MKNTKTSQHKNVGVDIGVVVDFAFHGWIVFSPRKPSQSIRSICSAKKNRKHPKYARKAK